MSAEVEETAPQQQQHENTYLIRPNFQHKFKPAEVKEIIHEVVKEELDGKDYDGEQVAEWVQNIGNNTKAKLKAMGYDRYKFVVQVVIGEQRGEGVKMGCRCFWDSDTDNYAQDIFMNKSMFCVVAAFGIFFY
ncbi:dynein light chain Tctex-type protein 2B-like [Styela clava]